jgi:prevent-host-death family protein
MKATILDLRYRMKSVLEALDRGEPVIVLHRGKEKARLVPIETSSRRRKPAADPAFGMWKTRKDLKDVSAYVRELRKPRFS